MLTPEQSAIVEETTRLLHADKLKESATFMSDSLGLKLRIETDDPKVCYPPLMYLFHWLMQEGAREEAARLLWPETLFSPKPQSCRDVWKMYDEAPFGLIMGAASMSKSYSMGVALMLDWVDDPAWTTIKVIGPSEEHLQANLFSHLVSLHRASKLPLPGDVGDLYIGLDRRDRTSSISGVIIPIGRTKKAGRLQGVKRKPRPETHPAHGPLSRLRVFVDEIENVPAGLWSDIDNLMSNFSEDDAGGLKIYGAYNPTNQYDEVGKRAEPTFGWADLDIDKNFRWTSTRGWEVLRLDAEQSENVKEGRTIFPGLQTKEGLARIAKNAGGVESPGYYSMGRGMYPSTGAAMTIFAPGIVPRMRGEPIWLHAPTLCGSVDLALEGGSNAVFTLGRAGMATGVKLPPSMEYINGHTKMFLAPDGRTVQPRPAIYAEKQFPLPKGDTPKMMAAIMEFSKRAGIRPEHLCVDRTGHGQGVFDMLCHEWGPVIGVNYSESPTNSKIMDEDQLTCVDRFFRVDSELWFAAKEWATFGMLWVAGDFLSEGLVQQLTQRKFSQTGKKSRVESKKDYKARGFVSPDEADSFCLFVHAVRRSLGLTASMTGGGSSSEEDEGWHTDVRIDASNLTDTLDHG